MRKYTLLLLLVGFSANAANTFSVGQRDFVFQDATRVRKISTYVWYPADPTSKETPIPEKGPFLPVRSAKNAPFAKSPEKFPVVLLSHGSMGMAKRLYWFAQYLAQNGVIAIAVDHPGNMTGDSTAEGAIRIWDRAKDLSFALDRVSETPDLKSHLDLSKVAAAGHSAGGSTVLLLAGARFSADQLTSPTPNCSGSGDPYFEKQCSGFKAINYKSFAQDSVEGDYADKRVKAIVAFDPGFVRSYQTDSLKKLDKKALLFVADKLAVPQDEIFSKEFSKFLSPSAVQVVPGSVHMTFLQPCKVGIPITDEDHELKELCADTGGKVRTQQEVAEKSLAFLRKSWGN